MRVGGQVSRCPQPFEFCSKPREVRIRRVRKVNVRQIEPPLDSRRHVVDTKRVRHDLAIGRQADEAEERGPFDMSAVAAAFTESRHRGPHARTGATLTPSNAAPL
jgi:hypothetical protein